MVILDIRQSQLSTPTYLFSILSLISLFRYITTMFYQSYTNITSTVYVGNKQTGRRVQLKTDPRYLCCYIQFCTYICLQILSYMYIIKSQCYIVIATVCTYVTEFLFVDKTYLGSVCSPIFYFMFFIVKFCLRNY